MALDSVKRTTVATGDDFATNKIGTKHHQLMQLADTTGALVGTESAAPLRTDAPRPATDVVTPNGSPEKSRQLKTGAGVLYEVRCILDPAYTSPAFLFVFDDTSAVAGSIRDRIPVPASGFGGASYPGGKAFTTGCHVALSSDYATFTAIATNSAVLFGRVD